MNSACLSLGLQCGSHTNRRSRSLPRFVNEITRPCLAGAHPEWIRPRTGKVLVLLRCYSLVLGGLQRSLHIRSGDVATGCDRGEQAADGCSYVLLERALRLDERVRCRLRVVDLREHCLEVLVCCEVRRDALHD